MLKILAVENEDFDKSLTIKPAIDKLKAVSKQLAILEQKKKISVLNEDYESSKK
jgi:hypothetical protein